MITKKEVLDNLDIVKNYIQEIENKKEEKVVGIAIKNRWTGSIIFQSSKTTYKDAIIEKGNADLCDANLRNADLCDADLCNADLRNADLCNADLRNADLRGANLRNANLYGANLCNADLCNADLCDANLRNADLNYAKFYGKGGTKKLKKSQLTDFLNALGFQVED